MPADMRKVFEFFSNAQNLELITPKELNFKILSPIPIEMKNETLIDYRIRLFGISFNWKTLISAWEPERRFVDEQLKGPYSKWIHTHSFETKEDGIMIKDEVLYRLPFFPLGELMFLAVRHQLNRIFDYRTTRIKEIFQEANQKNPRFYDSREARTGAGLFRAGYRGGIYLRQPVALVRRKI